MHERLGTRTAAFSTGVVERGGWRGRRLVAAVLLAAAGLTAVALGAGWPRLGAPGWSGLVALTAVLAGLTLATFVPHRGSGRLVDVGCGSCAAVAAVGPVLALWWLASSPVDAWQAALAAGVSAAALGKRLTDPLACPR